MERAEPRRYLQKKVEVELENTALMRIEQTRESRRSKTTSVIVINTG